ncbi:hypothetical protein ACFQ6Q_00180 [Streptomyces sp. NPDC056437]|uniref:hypothetical protein n=1 Tax=Streptomyces sp. NPDC056437 TaxID=3345816 RepID=UPI00369C5FAE
MAGPADALQAAENELRAYRQRLAQVTTWIHDPTHDHTARTALARHLGLPEPRPERTPSAR